MLVLISDLHLTDGTTAPTLPAGALEIFAEHLHRLAVGASWRSDGRYRPVARIDVVLLGDVLDCVRSSHWITQSRIRPWSDPRQEEFTQLISHITDGILRHNEVAIAMMRKLGSPEGLAIPAADSMGRPTIGSAEQPVSVKLHYMVGNHDWFYYLAGAGMERIRQSLVRNLGLADNSQAPLAHDPIENAELLEVMRRHRVVARHGDVFDPMSFTGDRGASSLNDALVIELLEPFLVHVEQEMADEIPPATLLSMREMHHMRPLLMMPVLLDGLLERTCPLPMMRRRIKTIWDRFVDAFLAVPFVRGQGFDGLADVLRFGQRHSTGRAAETIGWLNSLRGQTHESYFPHAMAEPDFRNRRVKHVVYGHTHLAENMPLDASYTEGYVLNQMYFNSGTWRRVFRPTATGITGNEFIAADTFNLVAFFQGDEREGRPYESLQGTLGVKPVVVPSLRLDPARQIVLPSETALPLKHELSPHFAPSAVPGHAVPVRRRV
jgi:hypothetical protein